MIHINYWSEEYMLLNLLGLAVQEDSCPLLGSWWDGTDVSHTNLPCWETLLDQGGKFMDYMNLPGKLVRYRRWWLCSVYVEALADPGWGRSVLCGVGRSGIGPKPLCLLCKHRAIIKFRKAKVLLSHMHCVLFGRSQSDRIIRWQHNLLPAAL